MTMRVDAKGKIFTHVVHKQAVPVLIQTATSLIHGYIYLHPEQRLLDELNGGERFIAVTEAQVYSANGEVLYRAGFLTLNKEYVVWIRPDDEAENLGLSEQPAPSDTAPIP